MSHFDISLNTHWAGSTIVWWNLRNMKKKREKVCQSGMWEKFTFSKLELMIIYDGLVWWMDTNKKEEKIVAAGGVTAAKGRMVWSIAERVNLIHPTAQLLLGTWGRLEGWTRLKMLAVNSWCEGNPPGASRADFSLVPKLFKSSYQSPNEAKCQILYSITLTYVLSLRSLYLNQITK